VLSEVKMIPLLRRSIAEILQQTSQPVGAETMMQVYTPPPYTEVPDVPVTQNSIVPPVNKSAVMTDYVTGARPVQQSPKVGESSGMVPGAQPVQRTPAVGERKKRRFPTLIKTAPVA